MDAGPQADGARRPRSAASYFILRGMVAGGLLGVPLYIGIDVGYLLLAWHGSLSLGSGSTAAFLWLIFVVDFGVRGLVFGFLIGTLTAAVALSTHHLVRRARHPTRVLAVGAVGSVVSGGLAWMPAHALSTLATTPGEAVYTIGAAIVGGLVAAATEHSFGSPARRGRRPSGSRDRVGLPSTR
ncbi:hypothetical protein [Frigoribacterium faeni]|uniref:hypothetical protein n=1 Tax=Frigoribacterium faeni TaxID=145483 RepID=UPI00141AA77E|nr:hypothetical protein [Frigoribacterium faeni]NIJ04554.1 hypothetical protein [Frigoribacterium faeni]